jgi:multisubunit Na+/H+ antiporter MnhC subunit
MSSAWLAIVCGVLFGSGIFLILRPSITRVILGVMLVSHSVNIALFVSSRVNLQIAPIIPNDADKLVANSAVDPVPQALILTAIVIGFGVLAFLLALALQAFRAAGTDDLSLITREESGG